MVPMQYKSPRRMRPGVSKTHSFSPGCDERLRLSVRLLLCPAFCICTRLYRHHRYVLGYVVPFSDFLASAHIRHLSIYVDAQFEAWLAATFPVPSESAGDLNDIHGASCAPGAQTFDELLTEWFPAYPTPSPPPSAFSTPSSVSTDEVPSASSVTVPTVPASLDVIPGGELPALPEKFAAASRKRPKTSHGSTRTARVKRSVDLGAKEQEVADQLGKDPKHIPRPPNAFIIFRSELCARFKELPVFERRHRQLSQICGEAWRSLSPEQKRSYEDRATAAAAAHMAKYPWYAYSPRRSKNSSRKPPRAKRITNQDSRRNQRLAQLVVEGIQGDAAAILSIGSSWLARECETASTEDPQGVTPDLPAASAEGLSQFDADCKEFLNFIESMDVCPILSHFVLTTES